MIRGAESVGGNPREREENVSNKVSAATIHDPVQSDTMRKQVNLRHIYTCIKYDISDCLQLAEFC